MKNNLLPYKLKELRKAHNYSQEDVASALGVIRQTYSHYETGKRVPNSEILYKLAGFYKIDINDLMQLLIHIDNAEYFEGPEKTRSGQYLEEFLEYISQPYNAKRLNRLSGEEKELLFYFEKLSPEDKKEIVEIIKIKVQKN